MTTTHLVLRYTHISFAMLALLAGAAAMTFRKGSWPHRKSGDVFFVSMLVMSAAGLLISVFITPIAANIMGGSLAFYLSATAWLVVWRKPAQTGRLEIAAMLLGLGVAATGFGFGLLGLNSPKGTFDQFPFVGYFIFASIALLASLADFRMINRGGYTGALRLTRHLWRVSLAFFMATGSFFFGQPKFVPLILRETGLYIVAGLLPLGLLIRVRVWPWIRKARAPQRVSVLGRA
jgi:hypothetical protein